MNGERKREIGGKRKLEDIRSPKRVCLMRKQAMESGTWGCGCVESVMLTALLAGRCSFGFMFFEVSKFNIFPHFPFFFSPSFFTFPDSNSSYDRNGPQLCGRATRRASNGDQAAPHNPTGVLLACCWAAMGLSGHYRSIVAAVANGRGSCIGHNH